MGNCFTCFKSNSSTQVDEVNNYTGTISAGTQHTSHSSQIVAGGTNTVIRIDHENCQPLTSSHHHHHHYPQHSEGSGGGGGIKEKFKSGSGAKKGLFSNGMASSGGPEAPLLDKDTQISDNALNKLFEEYKDGNEDAILSEGIERLCRDLDYKPDDFAILVLAWCLDAKQMCCFTKAEFIQGLQMMNASTIDEIKLRLQQKIEQLANDTEMFKKLYKFTFLFGLEPGQRILSLDMAIILWRLVFTVHTPPILDRWLNYLEKNPSIRGLTRDTWNMFLNFSESCDISQYDANEAWPSLFDDFVEYENDRLNQNVTDAECKNALVEATSSSTTDYS